MKSTSATWHLECKCDCPECGRWIDILPQLDDIPALETGPGDIEIECPECAEEFIVERLDY